MWAVLHRRKLSSAQIILFGFALVILIGAMLLMLPLSSKTVTVPPFFELPVHLHLCGVLPA